MRQKLLPEIYLQITAPDPAQDLNCCIKDLKIFFRKKSWWLKNEKIDNLFNSIFFTYTSFRVGVGSGSGTVISDLRLRGAGAKRIPNILLCNSG
jgi:hypothetical protein